ncbi:diacylglycerol/lipid kinase family protein [Thermogemmatispora carboxidivorans]|uniref:diacylglycerol/lipid kinase family protein n=1 Tax=Thermogemmatispora carboxidivorans TaxID=1382306 RepID=UPI000699D7F6|nr:diacylglycerol kinase family protein [Thermogemmatispora carboxidivorans]
MPGKRHAIVIHSPHSGRAPQLEEALKLLQEAGIEPVNVEPITSLNELPPQGATWQAQGIDLAIAAGGDGLVGGMIRHVIKAGPVLAILPLGTANDTARSLAIPQDLAGAVEVIVAGQEAAVDVGMALPPAASSSASGASDEEAGGDYFCHTLTIGLNVEFARLATSSEMRERFGAMTYPVAALEALRTHEPLEVVLEFEGLAGPAGPATAGQPEDELRYQVLQVAAINAPVFGGPLQLSIPGASVTDHLLDIVVVQGPDWKEIAATIGQLFAGSESTQSEASAGTTRHPAELTTLPGLHHWRASSVTISTPAGPCEVTLDGEVKGKTPITVRIAPEPLRVLVPAGWQAQTTEAGQ